MSEKIVGLEKTKISELYKPVALRVEINNNIVSDYNMVRFMFIKAEVPFFKNRLLYLPEYYISMQRIKDIDEEYVGFPKDVSDSTISKISIVKNSVTEGKIENFYTLAYIAYLGLLKEKRYQFDYDHMGSIYYRDSVQNHGIQNIKSRQKSLLYLGPSGVGHIGKLIKWDVRARRGRRGQSYGD